MCSDGYACCSGFVDCDEHFEPTLPLKPAHVVVVVAFYAFYLLIFSLEMLTNKRRTKIRISIVMINLIIMLKIIVDILL
jgi:hypothetical protein